MWGLRKRPYTPGAPPESPSDSGNGDPKPEGVALAYFGDTTTAPGTFVDHLRMVATVLRRLVKAGLTTKGTKCKWARKEVEFLGFVASEEGVKPHESKVAAVRNYPMPKSATELLPFTQLASFYRRFTKRFAGTSAPLNLTRKKGVAFH